MKRYTPLVLFVFLVSFIIVPVVHAQEGNFAFYDGWSQLTEREKLCFVLGYGYGTGKKSLAITPPLNFVRQIDHMFENPDYQVFSVYELFPVANWLFLGFSPEDAGTYLLLQSKCLLGQRITLEELRHMEMIRDNAEELEKMVESEMMGQPSEKCETP
ncbi:MAG: hypothetical protein JW971_03560 [Synergistales bacterium]|nr:hypothetical protein [Synergistales bacterium]